MAAMNDVRGGERGEGRAKLIVWLTILGIGAYLMFMIVPPYVNDYQLRDTLQAESRFFAAHMKSAEAVRNTVWNEMQSLRIPAQREAIIISDAGRVGHLEVKYTVVVELPGYKLNLNFDPVAESPIL